MQNPFKRKKSNDHFSPSLIIELAEVLKYLQGQRILALGCNDIRILEVLKAGGYDIFGLCEDSEKVKTFRKAGFSLFKESLNSPLPYGNKTFDSVFSVHSLESFNVPSDMVKESIRIASSRAIHITRSDLAEEIMKKIHAQHDKYLLECADSSVLIFYPSAIKDLIGSAFERS